jgi:hypothetical protein
MKRITAWLFAILVAASLASIQAMTDTTASASQQATRQAILNHGEPLLPSLPVLKLLSFGNQPLAADLLWLQTIQYFGGGAPTGSYPTLGKMVERIVELDPQFSYPYEFGLVVLPFMNQTETAERIGLQARQELPENGLLTFYLATVYHLNIFDYQKAAELYELAATQEGAPPATLKLAEVARKQIANSVTNREAAKIFWRTAAEQARNDQEYEWAIRWLTHMEIVDSLEIAARQFKNEHGRFPANLEELKEDGKIGTIPRSPLNRRFILEPDGSVSFDEVITER